MNTLSQTATAAPRATLRGATGERRLPCLFLVLEHARPLAAPLRISLEAVDRVELGRGVERSTESRVDAGARVLELRVPDPRMSSRHARLSRVLGRWLLEDLGSKNGTFLDELPVSRAELDGRALLQLGHTWLCFDPEVLIPEGPPLPLTREPDPADPLATTQPALERTLQSARQVAVSDVPILILGPTGTGKEVTARAIHALSGRRGTIVPVNCGALPESLVESELFGHRKGAFSGATEDRVGLVRSADAGTLFLDEIGDLPLVAQASLLRVLQEREVLAVGGQRAVSVDFRCIAATHRAVDDMIEAGHFRRDLHARLAGLTLTLPPLAERVGDLGMLLGRMIREHPLSPSAAFLLLRHGWPGNVRELEQTLRTARILAGEAPIGPEHLPLTLRSDPGTEPGEPAVEAPLDDAERAQKTELVALLTEHRGNVSAVARATGKARMQIQRWMKRYGLRGEQFRD